MNFPLELKSTPLGGKSLGDFMYATAFYSHRDHTVARSCRSVKVIMERLSADQQTPAIISSVIVPDQPSRSISMADTLMFRK